LHVAVLPKVQSSHLGTVRNAYSGLQIDGIGVINSGGTSSSLTKAVTAFPPLMVKKRVWRRRGEQFSDDCVVERESWGGPSIMVLVGIGLFRKHGPVVFQNIGQSRGNGVISARYID
jgi:hypothetical protein